MNIDQDLHQRISDILDRPTSSLDLNAYRRALLDKRSWGRSTGSDAHLHSHWKFAVEPADHVSARTDVVDSSRIAKEGQGGNNALHCLRALLENGPLAIRELAGKARVEEALVLSFIEKNLGSEFECSAVDSLATTVEPLEICRWPCSPYEIYRTYWENSAAVRSQCAELDDSLNSYHKFITSLRRLHITFLLGANLDSFYIPDSETRKVFMERGYAPGQFRDRPTSCPVPLGFARYFDLLGRKYPSAQGARANVREGPGRDVVWGELRYTMSSANPETNGVEYFYPTEIIIPEHVECLRQDLIKVSRACREDGSTHFLKLVATAFQHFICLHPFPAGNMGLVMVIINHFLRVGRGRYLPHCHLDWVAHRLAEADFADYFTRMFERFSIVPGDSSSEQDAVDRILNFRRLQNQLTAIGRSPNSNELMAQLSPEAAGMLLLS